MTITITKNPRDSIEVRRNYCAAPIGDGYTQSSGWSSLGAGAMAAASGTINKSYASAPGAIGGSGIRYVDTSWTPGAWRHISAYAFSLGYTPKMRIACTFFDASNNQLASVNSAVTALVANFTVGWEGLFQAPPNTAYVNVDLVHDSSSGVPGAGNGIAFSHVLIEGGTDTGLLRYFDGSTYANGNGSLSTTWANTAGFSQSIMYDWDPANVITPPFGEGWDHSNPGRNNFFDFLDDTFGVALRTGGARVGTLRLKWGGGAMTPAAAREAALAASVQFGKAATFSYVDTDLGNLAPFTFVVDSGGFRLYASDSRTSWFLDVPYRAI